MHAGCPAMLQLQTRPAAERGWVWGAWVWRSLCQARLCVGCRAVCFRSDAAMLLWVDSALESMCFVSRWATLSVGNVSGDQLAASTIACV